MNELAMEVWVPKAPEELFRLAFDDGLRLRRWYGAPPGCFRTGGEIASGPGDTYRVALTSPTGCMFRLWAENRDGAVGLKEPRTPGTSHHMNS
jgi:hypothetical protein